MSEPRVIWVEDNPTQESPWNDWDAADAAATELYSDHVVVFPTDTVYGLIASAVSDEGKGYHRVYQLKDRGFDKPLALLVEEGGEPWRFAVRWIDRYSPPELRSQFEEGRLTVVLPPQAIPSLCDAVSTLQPGNIAVRCPQHYLSIAIQNFGYVWATSVNLSGQPPATTADEVLAWLDELRERGIDPPELVVLSRTPGSGKPSRVVDLTGDEPVWIR